MFNKQFGYLITSPCRKKEWGYARIKRVVHNKISGAYSFIVYDKYGNFYKQLPHLSDAIDVFNIVVGIDNYPPHIDGMPKYRWTKFN